MQVGNTSGEIARSEAVQRVQHGPQTSVAQNNPSGIALVRRADEVEISDAARALSAGEDPSETQASALDPRRASEIRSKILSGAYNSAQMADQVARAILGSGEL